MSEVDDRKNELAAALGKVASLSSWEDLIQAVSDLRDDVESLEEQLAQESMEW